MGWWSAVREAVGGRGPHVSASADRVSARVVPSVSTRVDQARGPEPAWPHLPPVQRTLAEPLEPSAPLDVFTSSLSSHQNPSFLAPLTHGVTSEMPGGLVNGLADLAPVAPQSYAAVGERPVPTRHATPSARKGPVVQRTAAWNPDPPRTVPLRPSLLPAPEMVSENPAGPTDPAQPEQSVPPVGVGWAAQVSVRVPSPATVQRTWPVVARQSERRPTWPDLPTRELVVSRLSIPASSREASSPTHLDPPSSGTPSWAEAPLIDAVPTVQRIADDRISTPGVPFELPRGPEQSVGEAVRTQVASSDGSSGAVVGPERVSSEVVSRAASASAPRPELPVVTVSRVPDHAPSSPDPVLPPPDLSVPGSPLTPSPTTVPLATTPSIQRSASPPHLRTAPPGHLSPTRVPAPTVGLLGTRAPRIHLQRLSSATRVPAAPQPVTFLADTGPHQTSHVPRPAVVQRAPSSRPPPSPPGADLNGEDHFIDAHLVRDVVALEPLHSSGPAVQRTILTPAESATDLSPLVDGSTRGDPAWGGAPSASPFEANPVPKLSGVYHPVSKLSGVHHPVSKLAHQAVQRRDVQPTETVKPTETATPPLPIVQRSYPATRSQQSAPSDQSGMSFASMFSAADAPTADGFTTVQLHADSASAPSGRAAADSGQLSDVRFSPTPVAQRQEDDATPPTLLPDPSSAPAPAAPAADQPSGADIDEMARRLFEPLSARLRAELWLDRERVGLVSDARA